MLNPLTPSLLFAGLACTGPGSSFDMERACPVTLSHGLSTSPLAPVPGEPSWDPYGHMVVLSADGFERDTHSFVPIGKLEQPDRFVELLLLAPGEEPEPRPQPELRPVPVDLEPLAAALGEVAGLDGTEDGGSFYEGQVMLAVHGDVRGERLVAALHLFWAQRHPELRLLAAARGAAPPEWLDPAVASARLAGGPPTWPEGCAELSELFSAATELGPLASAAVVHQQSVLERAARRCDPADVAHILTNFQLAVCEHSPVVRWSVDLDPDGVQVAVDPGATWADLAPTWLAYEGRAIWPVLLEEGGEQRGVD